MIPPGLERPVGSIWCIGRNYAEHVKELGNHEEADPVVFLKPASSLMFDGGVLTLPKDSRRVDHEAELVLCVAPELKIAVGIDFTARDLQAEAKSKGLPWTSCKGRPGFAAVGNFAPMRSTEIEFALSVNGQERQRGHTRDMIWPVERLLDYLSRVYALREGDLVFTGTPAGVAPVHSGDAVEARLEGGASVLRLSVR